MGKHHKEKPPKRVKVILRDEITTKAQKKYRKQLDERRKAALKAINRQIEKENRRRYGRG